MKPIMKNHATELSGYLGADGLALGVPECETVELMDEALDGPDDFVVFKNKQGFPVMWMPRRVYEWFRDHPEYAQGKIAPPGA